MAFVRSASPTCQRINTFSGHDERSCSGVNVSADAADNLAAKKDCLRKMERRFANSLDDLTKARQPSRWHVMRSAGPADARSMTRTPKKLSCTRLLYALPTNPTFFS